MRRQLSLLVGSTVLTALLSLTAAAQECANDGAPANVYGPEYSNGGPCACGRGPAILTPVEAFGVHPPGPDPADLNRCFFHRCAEMFIPYYAPLSPTSTSVRWKPWCYFPLMPYYTPYYCGYCPHRCHTPEPPPYGFDGGWGPGPTPDPDAKGVTGAPLNYGVYTSILKDDTVFWNMGGNGLVPYGTPRPPHGNHPDLVDMIRVSRQHGGAPIAAMSGEGLPAILPPTEKADEKGGSEGDKKTKEEAPEEKPALPQ